MKEVGPFSGGQPMLPEDMTAMPPYETGDYSTTSPERVASASGSTKEKHASGSYGATAETLGSLVRSVGGM